MSWHYLQGQEVESWEADSLDGAPSVLLRLIPMPEKSCYPASGTVSLNPSLCGMTYQPLMGIRGEAMPESSQPVSRAKTSALPIMVAKGLTDPSPACSTSPSELLARFDQTTCSWKTPATSLIGESGEFSGRWPRWAMWDVTGAWVVKPLASTSRVKGRGLLLRPQASDGKAFYAVSMESTRSRVIKKRQLMLIHQVLLAAYENMRRGVANVPFWESLMGIPIGWTDCEPLAICNLRDWLRSYSDQSSSA